jgi:hypothetical protein
MEMMMKRSIVILAAALAALSTSALAEDATAHPVQQMTSGPVKLNDAQLDAITAGSEAVSEIVLFNRGKANVLQISDNHLTCVNCLSMDVSAGTWGFMNVMTPKGKIINVTIGRSPYQ